MGFFEKRRDWLSRKPHHLSADEIARRKGEEQNFGQPLSEPQTINITETPALTLKEAWNALTAQLNTITQATFPVPVNNAIIEATVKQDARGNVVCTANYSTSEILHIQNSGFHLVYTSGQDVRRVPKSIILTTHQRLSDFGIEEQGHILAAQDVLIGLKRQLLFRS